MRPGRQAQPRRPVLSRRTRITGVTGQETETIETMMS